MFVHLLTLYHSVSLLYISHCHTLIFRESSIKFLSKVNVKLAIVSPPIRVWPHQDECWEKIINEKINLPAHSIKLYDSDGNKTGRMVYQDNMVTLESDPSTATFVEVDNQETPATPPSENLDDVPSMEEENTCADDAPSMEAEGSDASTANGLPDDVPSMEAEGSEASTANGLPDDVPSMEGEGSETANTGSCLNLNHAEHDEGLKSSAGNYIKRLIGSDDDLVEFDHLRFKLKAAKRAGKRLKATSIQNYAELLVVFEAKIRLVESDRAAKLKELEQTHFQKYGKLPAKTRGSHYYNILKERNLAIAILRMLCGEP